MLIFQNVLYISLPARSVDVVIITANNNDSTDNDGYQLLSPKFFIEIFSFTVIIFPFKRQRANSWSIWWPKNISVSH